ncbi:hypothetical protein C2G38_2239825 [Gigaspora rosea]|uniref:Uncharacterized protein n=1 Tax=Gigaspora rosea TaxID=44941 RepID=A0A397W6L6_9GLOM|nr:hypothetical protein C2G38_2239825 [Gigaspora rosea]
MESFNGIIKNLLNKVNTLYNVEKVIEKRLEDELQYNKLVGLKAPNTLIRLPHLSSQFFTNIDAIFVQFLTPLNLSWQRFQISQSLIYEGCLASFSVEILEIDTVNDAFIEDINNEPQITLKSLLNGIEVSSNNSDEELIRMLKNFITVKWQTCKDLTRKPKIVNIRGAPFKKKMKSFTEKLGKKVNV